MQREKLEILNNFHCTDDNFKTIQLYCEIFPEEHLKEIRLSISCKKCILMESSWPRMTPQSKERKAPWCSQTWCRISMQCNAMECTMQYTMQCNGGEGSMQYNVFSPVVREHRVYSGEGAIQCKTMQYNVKQCNTMKTMLYNVKLQWKQCNTR